MDLKQPLTEYITDKSEEKRNMHNLDILHIGVCRKCGGMSYMKENCKWYDNSKISETKAVEYVTKKEFDAMAEVVKIHIRKINGLTERIDGIK